MASDGTDGSVPLKKSRLDGPCEQCQNSQSKYSCPKCNLRTCSVECVRKHKEENDCDGQPKQWIVVKKYSDFTSKVSVHDQHFLNDFKDRVESNINLPPRNDERNNGSETICNTANTSPPCRFSNTVNYLLTNARLRRIWLTVDSDEAIAGSRHEGFSDTIFWTVKMIFRYSNKSMTEKCNLTGSDVNMLHDVEEGELADDNKESELTDDALDIVIDVKPMENSKENDQVVEYCYTVCNIPETLTVRTLIRQFVRPKAFGPLVSRSDLDMDKLKPFLDTPDEILMYMPVKVNADIKYYSVDTDKSLVDNLRNRFVHNHVEFIIVLATDILSFEPPTDEQVDSLHMARRSSYHSARDHGPNRRFRGGFNNRRNFGRGGRGNYNNRGMHNNRGNRRHNDRDDALEHILSSRNIREDDVAALR